MKAQIYSSRYIKTLYQVDLKDSTPITLSLMPEDDLIRFLRDLITDLIQRRNIEKERILIITDTAWLKHAINTCLETTFTTQMDHLFHNRTILVCDTQSEQFKENNDQFSVCIVLNYIQISENVPELLDNFIENNPNTLFIGINDQACNGNLSEPLLGAGVREVSYDPISFEPFLKRDILVWIKNLFINYNNYHEITKSYDIIFGGLEELNEESSFSISIGTSSYDLINKTENTNEEYQEYNDIQEFLITISFSKYELNFSVELQDFDWNGTAFYGYTLNIAEKIDDPISNDENKFEEIMDEVKDRLNRYRNVINFKFEGFDV